MGGAAFMLWRTIVLISAGTLGVYVPWVGGLLVVEAAVDSMTLGLAVLWLVTGRSSHQKMTLRATVAVVLVHALRVSIFVLGRTGPWIDFDIRPEERVRYAESWSWTGVVIAGGLAALSICALLAVWYRSRHRPGGQEPLEGVLSGGERHGAR